MIYDIEVIRNGGKKVDMNRYRGKKLIIVNTASECGFTPQYQQLQEIYQFFGDKVSVLGFPSNDFGSQEPGNDIEIKEFCERNYGVTFPLSTKVKVTGKDIHPMFKWLTDKSENGTKDAEVSWNFQKFLINEDGSLYDIISPTTEPTDSYILNWIGVE